MAALVKIAASIAVRLIPTIFLTGCGLSCISGYYNDARCPGYYEKRPTPAQIEAYRAARAKQAQMAEEGDPYAQFQAADGSPEKRRYWYCRAATKEQYLQGNAMYRLGQEYEKTGEKIDAYKWYALAVAHPSVMDREAANRRDRVAESMTAADVEEGKRRVAAWKPGDCGKHPAAV